MSYFPNLFFKQCMSIFEQKLGQGGHGTGKTGNLAVNFSRQGKHREFSKFIFLHRENGANTGKILNFLKILLLKWQQGDGAFLS